MTAFNENSDLNLENLDNSLVLERDRIPEVKSFKINHNITLEIIGQEDLKRLIRIEDVIFLRRNNDNYFEYTYVLLFNGMHKVFISNTQASINELICRPTVMKQRKDLYHYLSNLPNNYEWSEEFKKNTIEREKLLLEVVTLANMLKLSTNSKEDVIREYFINSQMEYERAAMKAINDSFEPKVFWVTDDDYDQTEHFGWIYGHEVAILKKIIENKKNTQVKVLDEATGFGHIIFTSAAILGTDLLSCVDFIGTDFKMKDMSFAQENAKRFPSLNSKWIVENIDSSDHLTNLLKFNENEHYDLLFLNHIIEHLNSKPILEYLKGWLSITKTLVVSVPFEDSLEHTISSHYHQFNEDILISIGNSLIIESDYNLSVDTSLIRGGVLIIQWI